MILRMKQGDLTEWHIWGCCCGRSSAKQGGPWRRQSAEPSQSLGKLSYGRSHWIWYIFGKFQKERKNWQSRLFPNDQQHLKSFFQDSKEFKIIWINSAVLVVYGWSPMIFNVSSTFKVLSNFAIKGPLGCFLLLRWPRRKFMNIN